MSDITTLVSPSLRPKVEMIYNNSYKIYKSFAARDKTNSNFTLKLITKLNVNAYTVHCF